MLVSGLNPYSQRFAERLFAAHPEWRGMEHVDPEGFPPPGSLLVEVPSPIAGRSLTIRTYGDQITVDFGASGWHEHFGLWSATEEDKAFGLALAFIADLIAERVVVTTRVIYGWAAWSRAVKVTEVRRPLFGKLEVYSWNGNVNVSDAG